MDLILTRYPTDIRYPTDTDILCQIVSSFKFVAIVCTTVNWSKRLLRVLLVPVFLSPTLPYGRTGVTGSLVGPVLKQCFP